MKSLLLCVLAGSLGTPALVAADMRIWTSRKGGTLEGTVRSVDGDNITLTSKDSKEIKLKAEDLSLADREHLVEFAKADPAIITGGKPGLVEKDVRIDTSTFKKLEGKLSLGQSSTQSSSSVGGFEMLETPNFLIATAGDVRPQAIAETAERLWYGMAFVHMDFRQNWGDKKMLILVVADPAAYTSLGEWYREVLNAAGASDAANRMKKTWEQSGSTTIGLPDDLQEKHKLMEEALVFNVKEASQFRKPLSPFMTHTIAGSLLGIQMGNVTSFGGEGYFAISTGHSYFKEISLAGKSETKLLSVSGTQNDDISSKSGFDDGSSWARSLKPLVRSGKVQAKLEAMLKWQPEELNPERLVLIYSFANYMESDSKRLAAFAKMIRRIEASKQIPAPEEFAKIFGFDSVAALETDWTKFITEGDFK